MSAELLDYLKTRCKVEKDIDLARKAMIDRATISLIRSGRRQVSSNHLLKFNRHLGIGLAAMRKVLGGAK